MWLQRQAAGGCAPQGASSSAESSFDSLDDFEILGELARTAAGSVYKVLQNKLKYTSLGYWQVASVWDGALA